MTQEDIPVKYSVPNSYSRAPYKSLCKVVLNYSEVDPLYRYYVQTSTDEERPNWEEMGRVLGVIFEPLFSDNLFIDECFDIIDGIKNATHEQLKKL